MISSSLLNAIRGFISYTDIPKLDGSRFDDLFVSLAQEQYLANETYKTWVDVKKGNPNSWKTWKDVTPLPIQFFKFRDVISYTPELTPNHRVFSSSGTGGQKSKVSLLTDEFYKLSLSNSTLDVTGNLLKVRLFPTSQQWESSSLAYMFDHMFGSKESEFIDVSEGGVVLEETVFDLLVDNSKPYLIFGTTYSMIQLFDRLIEKYGGRPFHLDSYIIDTGGSKNIERSMSRPEYLKLFTRATGLPENHAISEYGMSEISSPAWGSGNSPLHLPPWARVQTLNPVTLKTEGFGFSDFETIVYYDLANVWTVCAIQTQDIGVADPRGNAILPLGRAEGAQAKGCSILAQNGLRV